MVIFGATDTNNACRSANCRYGYVLSRVDELDHNHRANSHRNNRDRALRGCPQQLVRAQYHSKRGIKQHLNDIFSPHGWGRFSTRDRNSSSRNYRDRGHNKNNRNYFYHYILVGLFQIICLASPVKAQTSDGTTVIANPQASSTGSVTNSAVQINQGSYSTQGFSGGHYCNSGTVVFTPFYLGGGFHPEYTRSENYGAQISISVPLDGRITELCKEYARKKIQQKRVDILLTRVRECTNMYEKGYMIRPESPFSAICDDVVPIAAYSKSVDSSQASSESE